MRDKIRRVMQDIPDGIKPHLPGLPNIDDEELGDDEATDHRKGGRQRQEASKDDDSDHGDKKKQSPRDWRFNPDLEKSWKCPEGKSRADYFNPATDHGRKNLERFPKIKHHDKSLKGFKRMCIKYQVGGTGRANCNNAHCPPSRLEANIWKLTDAAFAKAYKGE